MAKRDKFIYIFLALSILIVVILLPVASEHPDGLEKVAGMLGFEDSAQEIYSSAPMPDYDILEQGSYTSVLTAGLIGIAITMTAALIVGRLLKNAS
ncbi:PDGLE domain-containing protein [Candidatus Woesearchaeota archaeon]|nr:PDGLE domain-containing protein [Candidatus Woesearchaeota archaeon]